MFHNDRSSIDISIKNTKKNSIKTQHSPHKRKNKKYGTTPNSNGILLPTVEYQDNIYSNADITRHTLIQDIVFDTRDAVVNISSQSISPTDELIINHGNGFFIKGHYIICPSSLVIIPPNPSNNTITRINKILITVSNVNRSGKSYSYEADVVGVDGASNIAILCINMDRKWNSINEPIRSCHPFLRWGKSRSSSPGDTVIVIGEISGFDRLGLTTKLMSGVSENGVVIGNIADNRYVSYGGSIPGELLLLSNIISSGLQSGLPIIDINGAVIGMYLHVEINKRLNIALSEFFMRRPVKALIRTFIDNFIPECYRGFIENIPHANNPFYRYNKACLGLSGILMSQIDFNTNMNHTIITSDSGPDNKEIVGYRISNISSNSPLHNVIFVGDIITHINTCPLGDRKGQISPSLIMWRVTPGSYVDICYKKESENFDKYHELKIITFPYDSFYDYPWYAIPLSESLGDISPILI